MESKNPPWQLEPDKVGQINKIIIIMTQTLLKTQRTEALSYADRVTIASVLTWDSINGTFNPNDIETICLKGDMVWVKLTNGAYPISRHIFRSILFDQRNFINKQIEQIIDIEEQEVLEAEREMSEIIHATATQEFYSEHLGLTEPIDSYTNVIFGKFIEQSDEEIDLYSVAENGCHCPNFTNEYCDL
jgi:hypothetical protein